MVPGSASNTLLSGSKFADADYMSIYTPTEGNIYDAKTTKLIVIEQAVLNSCRCPNTGIYRISLQENVTNLNTGTLL